MNNMNRKTGKIGFSQRKVSCYVREWSYAANWSIAETPLL